MDLGCSGYRFLNLSTENKPDCMIACLEIAKVSDGLEPMLG